MDLILWRHAQAEELSATMQSDNDRQLTSKGKKQAAQMASWLNNVLPIDCLILASPSQRTRQTAQALAALGRKIDIADPIRSASSVDQLLAGLQPRIAKCKSVLVVGHQPLLGQTVCQLIPEIQYAPIRKANVWWLSYRDNEGPFLKAIMAPELVKGT